MPPFLHTFKPFYILSLFIHPSILPPSPLASLILCVPPPLHPCIHPSVHFYLHPSLPFPSTLLFLFLLILPVILVPLFSPSFPPSFPSSLPRYLNPSVFLSIFPYTFQMTILFRRKKMSSSQFLPMWDVAFPYCAFLDP